MKGKLKLNDLLGFTEEELAQTRIRFNKSTRKANPIDIYKSNPEKLLEWNYHNNKTYKQNQISIGLVRMDTSKDEWLLFTVGKIKKVKDVLPKFYGVAVDYETFKDYEDLYGRVIIEYHNNSRQMLRKAIGLIDDLIIKEILPSMYTGFDFPGYKNVKLFFKDLATIVNGNYPSYKNALKQQKAVYLITDTNNGNLYVGSATGSEMLLQRWKDYVKNGHGNNKDLKVIYRKRGFEYIKKYFQYTILENYNARTDDKYILEREKYWKRVLYSKEFGYNENI